MNEQVDSNPEFLFNSRNSYHNPNFTTSSYIYLEIPQRNIKRNIHSTTPMIRKNRNGPRFDWNYIIYYHQTWELSLSLGIVRWSYSKSLMLSMLLSFFCFPLDNFFCFQLSFQGSDLQYRHISFFFSIVPFPHLRLHFALFETHQMPSEAFSVPSISKSIPSFCANQAHLEPKTYSNFPLRKSESLFLHLYS